MLSTKLFCTLHTDCNGMTTDPLSQRCSADPIAIEETCNFGGELYSNMLQLVRSAQLCSPNQQSHSPYRVCWPPPDAMLDQQHRDNQRVHMKVSYAGWGEQQCT